MLRKRNAPALAKREGVECLLGGDIDAYATEALPLQQITSRLPILRQHFGLDALALIQGGAHG